MFGLALYQVIKKERDQVMVSKEWVFKVDNVIFSYHTKNLADKIERMSQELFTFEFQYQNRTKR